MRAFRPNQKGTTFTTCPACGKKQYHSIARDIDGLYVRFHQCRGCRHNDYSAQRVALEQRIQEALDANH